MMYLLLCRLLRWVVGSNFQLDGEIFGGKNSWSVEWGWASRRKEGVTQKKIHFCPLHSTKKQRGHKRAQSSSTFGLLSPTSDVFAAQDTIPTPCRTRSSDSPRKGRQLPQRSKPEQGEKRAFCSAVSPSRFYQGMYTLLGT